MKMEVPPSTVSFTGDDRKNLECLLDVFGSVVSLEDIAAAYCKAGRDPTIAGDILGDMQASTSKTIIPASKEKIEDTVTVTSDSVSDDVGDSVNMTSESVSEINSKRADPSSSKQKKLSVSMGTVSSMIRKDYVTNRPPITETSTRNKPLKLSADDFPTPEITDENVALRAAAMSETLPSSIEEFLFKMLGNGFSLDMSIIEEVVGQCGYDLNKSMDKLIDMSASTLEKSDDILKSVESPDFASVASQETPSMSDPSSRSKVKNMTKDGFSLSKREKDRYDLQREVLQSLFNVPARHGDVDDVICPLGEAGRSKRLSYVVTKPLQETVPRQILIRTPQSDAKNGEDNEDSYEVLRKSVKEYWITMKEYYKAAADAFYKGDHEKARKLLEEGHFFMTKARETDERSAQKLLETSYIKESVTVDVHDFEPKEAVGLLKIQLTSLCGISSIPYLKIVVGITDEEAKGRRKRVIIKLLERDSIAWTEEEDGKVIVIRADEINPRKLTFAKKSTVRA